MCSYLPTPFPSLPPSLPPTTWCFCALDNQVGHAQALIYTDLHLVAINVTRMHAASNNEN